MALVQNLQGLALRWRQLVKDCLAIEHTQGLEDPLKLVEIVLGLLFLLLIGRNVAEIVFCRCADMEEEIIHGLRHLVQGRIDITLNEQ
ncbi:hypothetical protein D3C77_596600 [compost metagenome]